MRYMTLSLLAVLLLSCGDGLDGRIEATGTMEATDITLSATVPGIVDDVRIHEGSTVVKGDTLLLIDDTDLRLQLRQTEAMLAAAEAQFALIMKGAREEDLRQAEASFESARKDAERMRDLRTSNSVTQKQLDDAELRYTVAKETYEKVRSGARIEERAAVRAQRDQVAAQVALLRKKVNDCRIVAPIGGTVLNRFLEPGEYVTPGGALLRLADLSVMEVMIYVPEAELPKISLGQKAEVKVDAFPDRTFDGEVVYVSPTAEFTPKNIQTKDERTKLVFGVKVRVPNPDGALKTGIPADVIL